MSAETLRKAAETLREQAGVATPGDWTALPGAGNVWRFPDEGAPTLVVNAVPRVGRGTSASDASYIATMHPGVGLGLADVLDESAAVWDDIDVGTLVRDDSQLDRLATLARLILGSDA